MNGDAEAKDPCFKTPSGGDSKESQTEAAPGEDQMRSYRGVLRRKEKKFT